MTLQQGGPDEVPSVFCFHDRDRCTSCGNLCPCRQCRGRNSYAGDLSDASADDLLRAMSRDDLGRSILNDPRFAGANWILCTGCTNRIMGRSTWLASSSPASQSSRPFGRGISSVLSWGRDAVRSHFVRLAARLHRRNLSRLSIPRCYVCLGTPSTCDCSLIPIPATGFMPTGGVISHERSRTR